MVSQPPQPSRAPERGPEGATAPVSRGVATSDLRKRALSPSPGRRASPYVWAFIVAPVRAPFKGPGQGRAYSGGGQPAKLGDSPFDAIRRSPSGRATLRRTSAMVAKIPHHRRRHGDARSTRGSMPRSFASGSTRWRCDSWAGSKPHWPVCSRGRDRYLHNHRPDKTSREDDCGAAKHAAQRRDRRGAPCDRATITRFVSAG